MLAITDCPMPWQQLRGAFVCCIYGFKLQWLPNSELCLYGLALLESTKLRLMAQAQCSSNCRLEFDSWIQFYDSPTGHSRLSRHLIRLFLAVFDDIEDQTNCSSGWSISKSISTIKVNIGFYLLISSASLSTIIIIILPQHLWHWRQRYVTRQTLIKDISNERVSEDQALCLGSIQVDTFANVCVGVCVHRW